MSLKNALFLVALFSVSLVCSRAETYYYDTVQYKLSDATDISIQTLTVEVDGETKYLWYTLDSEGNRVNCTEFPAFTAEDSIVFAHCDNNIGTNNKKVWLDVDINVASVEYSMTYTTLVSNNGSTLTTTGDFILNSYMYYYGAGNLKVGGNLTINCAAMGSPDARRGILDSLWVEGVTTIRGATNNRPSLYVGTGSGSIDNPDSVFKGGITATAVQNQTENYMYDGSPLTLGMGGTDSGVVNRNVYSWINGASGTAAFMVNSTAASTGSWTIVFTNNAGDASSSSSLYQTAASGAKMSIVMRSVDFDNDKNITGYKDYSQSFTGSEFSFTGGVTLLSGGLYLNYGAETSSSVNHGNLKLARESGAASAKFGNSGNAGGNFLFADMEVSDGGGTIVVKMDYAEGGSGIVCDTLTLSGSAKGEGAVIIDLKNFNGNNPDEFIDFMIENDVGIKVISWAEAAESGITFTTTDDYKVYDYYGEQYYFTVQNAADGLYITYTVPEPAEWAAILGLAAIALAAHRRRRK
ncbi:MAG: hypothetical protein DBX55_00115 [Verrucomicrobia bacterium]|nr:MAG: hypothetical protein DBX55_00115 [Verrucomicrobiota bacterium]